MLRLATDENLNGHLLRGLIRRMPDLDIIRVQDVGLAGVEDPKVLEWCAQEGRLLVTHDVQTVTKYAHERVSQGAPMPGVIEIAQTAPLGAVIEDLELLVKASELGEFDGQVLHLPL